MPIRNDLKFRRWLGKFDWSTDEPGLIWYSVNIATMWLQREAKQKGYVTADHLNKACGILTEEIFAAELNELNVPHLRTVPLLDKTHPTNARKPYDFKIGGYTIDLKSISPLPSPSIGHHKNLNVNHAEIENIGLCDYYICTKCYPELPPDTQQSDELPRDFALKILQKVERVEFLGYATGADVLKARLVPTAKPFHSKPPPHESMRQLARLLNIPLEPPTSGI
ncbi:MAG: hypothetical protein GX799_11945 [Crenarchaeota archaeon]|nr:hypothetical protein [Thermoproteota archaeon]